MERAELIRLATVNGVSFNKFWSTSKLASVVLPAIETKKAAEVPKVAKERPTVEPLTPRFEHQVFFRQMAKAGRADAVRRSWASRKDLFGPSGFKAGHSPLHP